VSEYKSIYTQSIRHTSAPQSQINNVFNHHLKYISFICHMTAE